MHQGVAHAVVLERAGGEVEGMALTDGASVEAHARTGEAYRSGGSIDGDPLHAADRLCGSDCFCAGRHGWLAICRQLPACAQRADGGIEGAFGGDAESCGGLEKSHERRTHRHRRLRCPDVEVMKFGIVAEGAEQYLRTFDLVQGLLARGT